MHPLSPLAKIVVSRHKGRAMMRMKKMKNEQRTKKQTKNNKHLTSHHIHHLITAVLLLTTSGIKHKQPTSTQYKASFFITLRSL